MLYDFRALRAWTGVLPQEGTVHMHTITYSSECPCQNTSKQLHSAAFLKE